jgi:hypothetical protein
MPGRIGAASRDSVDPHKAPSQTCQARALSSRTCDYRNLTMPATGDEHEKRLDLLSARSP